MMRQMIQRDRVTGLAVVSYVNCGPAKPAARNLSPVFTTSNHGQANVAMAGGGKVTRKGTAS